ncbi:chemotaxis protein CheB, partial [Phenylobacterium sp.]|uniref:chemotaxis protein CheB n=1 Tax=Phenylobacterium sp. TaxID=1871053 RepID=UPI00286AF48E
MATKATGSPEPPAPHGRGRAQPRARPDPGASDVLLIVGIGASAGGLEAFKSFLANTPPDTGMAFVLVQHLSPDHKSLLAELLGKATAMSVIEATDGLRVTANCVVVIPPDATLTIVGGRLAVSRPAPPRDRRRPIDTFFQSLAADQGEKAIGVILAGTGSDGSLGLATIKEHGGLTLAQAEFDSHALAGMPQSATLTGQVDDVLAVEAMPARLMAYRQHLTRVVKRKDGTVARAPSGSHLPTILAALRARSGHDFSEYKEKTLARRLQRRMQVLHLETPDAYIDHHRQQPEELDLLFRELLIGVTEFFRDPAAFEALAATVLKNLVAGKGADDDIRVWVPGCSTGQEAYTLAILLREAMDGRRPRPKVQIFGTDIDDRAIGVARLGRYRRPAAGLSAERAERWFTEEGDNVCVVSEIRDMCVFSTHSVIRHPPFSKLDLISCRNLLIYLDADMQDRVMRTLHYALKPNGWLLLGSSESVTRATQLFGVTDKKHRIFQRREVNRPSLPDLAAAGRGLETQPHPDVGPRRADDRIDKSTRRVTEKYNPPHVAIDSHDRIVRFSGPAMGQYVELSPGAPSFAL